MKMPYINIKYIFVVYGISLILDLIYNSPFVGSKNLPLFSIFAFVVLLSWTGLIGVDPSNVKLEHPRITLHSLDERLKKLEMNYINIKRDEEYQNGFKIGYEVAKKEDGR